MTTHQDAIDHDLVDRYAAGTLNDSERESFEEHYFSCDECFGALQALEQLRGGVRHLAAKGEIASTAPALQSQAVQRSSRVPAWLLTAAALFLAAAGVWLMQSREAGLQQQLAASQQRAADLERALAQARAPAAVPETVVAALTPEGNVPLAILQATRATGDAAVLAVPSSARHFIVWIDDLQPRAAAELALLSADGRIIHTVGGLTPNSNGAIVASFPAEALPAGTYTLRLSVAGIERLLGEYRLTLTRPDAR